MALVIVSETEMSCILTAWRPRSRDCRRGKLALRRSWIRFWVAGIVLASPTAAHGDVNKVIRMAKSRITALAVHIDQLLAVAYARRAEVLRWRHQMRALFYLLLAPGGICTRQSKLLCRHVDFSNESRARYAAGC